MKAVVKYGDQDGMVEIREVPIPKIEANEVLLKVMAAGVCGSDIEMWRGKQSCPVNTPVICGHEFCGLVEEIGKSVEHFKIGDKVTSETHAYVCGKCLFCRCGNYHMCSERLGFGYGVDGAFTGYVRVREGILHSLSEGISFEEASLTEIFCVAYNAIAVLSRLSAGDTVVIIGPGPIGLSSLQMAGILGAGQLIIVGTKADYKRLEVAKELGADMCITLDEQDPVSIVMDQTHGVGVDLVVNAAGNSASMYHSLQLVRRLGQITKIGWGPEPLDFSLDQIISRSVTLQGSFSHNWQTWEHVIRLMENGRLQARPLITQTLPVTQWRRGYELMEKKEAIKVVLKPVS